MISLKNVSKSYGDSHPPAVRVISLEINRGQFVILLGESGCGKTTTLKLINRLIEPTSGAITIDGHNTASLNPVELRRAIGYVFQEIGLFPHMTVAENIGVVPRLLGWSRNRIDKLLSLVGLDPSQHRHRLPAELSGGQQQRVGLARALAAEPKLMLMDEPLGALDPITRDDIQNEIRHLHQELHLTVVMVTHDITEALTLGDRIAVMKDGRIVAFGAPEQLLADPGHPYAEQLFAKTRRQTAFLDELLNRDNRHE